MTDYNCFDDAALCKMTAAGDNLAEEELFKRYYRLVRACSRPFFLTGGDSEDLLQEGMLGLLAAIKQFDPEKNASFRTFAELCIKNRIYTAIKSASRFKHTPLNNYVSFEVLEFSDSPNVFNSLRDPEELIIARERAEEISQNLRSLLSELEKNVLDFYLQGLSYEEMATQLGKPVKSVDNAIQRIRRKLARYLTKIGVNQ